MNTMSPNEVMTVVVSTDRTESTFDAQSGHDVAVLWDAEPASEDPEPDALENWAKKVLEYQKVGPCEIAIKVVSSAESESLNAEYRGKAKPTNVLSFPLDAGQVAGPLLLGDLALCADVVRREALEQGKEISAHYAHMVVHGVLHLLGYDHVESGEAEEMEQIERDVLRTMGFSDPYQEVG